MTSSIGAIIASKNRRKIISAFKKAGAVSPENAKTLEVIGLSESVMFKIQKMRGIIVESDAKRFYLDEIQEAKSRRIRLLILSVGIIVIMILFFISNSY